MNPIALIVAFIVAIFLIALVAWYITHTLKRTKDYHEHTRLVPQEFKVESYTETEVVSVSEDVEPNRCPACGSPLAWHSWKKNIGWSDTTQSSTYQVCAGFFCSTSPESVRSMAGHYGYDSNARRIGFPVDFPEGFYEDFESPTSIPNNG
jgi:hypothetical protein